MWPANPWAAWPRVGRWGAGAQGHCVSLCKRKGDMSWKQPEKRGGNKEEKQCRQAHTIRWALAVTWHHRLVTQAGK
jgi:hypothetical protein